MIFIFVEKGATLKKESSKIRSQTFAKYVFGAIYFVLVMAISLRLHVKL